MVATAVASYFLLTADYGPEPNAFDPVCFPSSVFLSFAGLLIIRFVCLDDDKYFVFFFLIGLYIMHDRLRESITGFMSCIFCFCVYLLNLRIILRFAHGI